MASNAYIVTLCSDLRVDRNYSAAKGHLVREVLRNDSAPAIVFGVAFSALHSVIVRISKKDGGTVSVTHTRALEFLPYFCESTDARWACERSRLGYMHVSDGVSYFYSALWRIPYAN